MNSARYWYLHWLARHLKLLYHRLETNFLATRKLLRVVLNWCVQLAISLSYFWTVFIIAAWYGYSFFGLELGSSFSPPLAEHLLAPAFFLPLFEELYYFFHHCRHMARQRVCVTRRFDFSTAFVVDLLKHLGDQDRDLVLDEIWTRNFFQVPIFFNSQNWISTHIFASLQAWISSPVPIRNWRQMRLPNHWYRYM